MVWSSLSLLLQLPQDQFRGYDRGLECLICEQPGRPEVPGTRGTRGPMDGGAGTLRVSLALDSREL